MYEIVVTDGPGVMLFHGIVDVHDESACFWEAQDNEYGFEYAPADGRRAEVFHGSV